MMKTLKQILVKRLETKFIFVGEKTLSNIQGGVMEWLKQKQKGHRVTDGYWRVYQELLEELER